MTARMLWGLVLIVLAVYAFVAGVTFQLSLIKAHITLNNIDPADLTTYPVAGQAKSLNRFSRWLVFAVAWTWPLLTIIMLVGRVSARAAKVVTIVPAQKPEIWLIPKEGRGSVN